MERWGLWIFGCPRYSFLWRQGQVFRFTVTEGDKECLISTIHYTSTATYGIPPYPLLSGIGIGSVGDHKGSPLRPASVLFSIRFTPCFSTRNQHHSRNTIVTNVIPEALSPHTSFQKPIVTNVIPEAHRDQRHS